MPFVIRHLLESTLFCLLLSLLACCLRRGATARHSVLLLGISKFAIPSVLLTATGARIAFLWPAAEWLSAMMHRFSAALTAVVGLLPRDSFVVSIWAFGAICLLTIWLRLLRKSRMSWALPSGEEEQALLRAKGLLRVGIPVQLRRSPAAVEPALWGIWRPTITIPEGLSERLTESELEAVLLHELAHAKRFDNLTAIFVHLLVCVFWFHPLLWLVERCLIVERERACDEIVIACGTKPQTYVDGILKVCRFHLFETAAGVSTLTGSGLKRRVELILDGRPSAPLLYVPRLLIAGLAILMTVVPIAGGYCEQCVSTPTHIQEK